MKTMEGGRADGIARWAWQDPAGRVDQALAEIRQLWDSTTDQAARSEIGDAGTMLSRLASSVGRTRQLANDAIELRFNPAELRDSRGRWTRFGATGQAADVMMKNREGFSVSVRTGGEPVSGFMVAQTDHTHTYPESILDDHAKLTRAIDDMLVAEKDAFRGRGDVYLGGWVHDGKLWLEPSDNIASREEAERAGRERNQIAIWDVNNAQEIQTGGSGGGRITEHANPQGDHRAGPGGLRGAARGGTDGDRQPAGGGHPLGAGPVMELISDQLDLAGADGILGQLIELAGNEAWRHERRGPHGEWVRGASAPPTRRGGVRSTASTVASSQRRVMQGHVVRSQQQAAAAIAEKVAEEKARRALEEARAEVERVTRQLREEAKTEETQKHRTKLALHGVLIMAGAFLAAIMAHFDVSPVLAAFAGSVPYLLTELTDWRKKL